MLVPQLFPVKRGHVPDLHKVVLLTKTWFDILLSKNDLTKLYVLPILMIMKKIITLFALTVLLLTTVKPTHAQNRCVLNHGNGSMESISYSDNLVIWNQSENSVSLSSKTEVKPQQRGSASSYTLNVYFPENSHCVIYVSDGDNILAQLDNMDGEFLSVELEEGTYQLFAKGQENATDRICYWIMDDLELMDDTDIQVDFSQCEYKLMTHLVDENGTPFSEIEALGLLYCVNFYWLGGVHLAMDFSTCHGYEEQVPDRWFSHFDERSALEFNVTIETGGNKSYFIETPKYFGLSDQLTFANTADELNTVQEKFHLQGYGPYYNVLSNKHLCRKQGGGGFFVTYYEFLNDDYLFDPSLPYSIVTNSKIENSNVYEAVETILAPTVYEAFDWNASGPNVYRDCILAPFYLNTDGEVVREALPYYQEDFCMISTNWFPETPAMVAMPTEEITSYGERTPLSCYAPSAFRGDSFPLGMNVILGLFQISGENSSERTCDYDRLIKVNIDGEDVYNDSIYLFNKDGNVFMPEVAAPVVVEVENNHLVANDVEKANHTRVMFNLENDDAIPPTMTFLRVLDGEGDEAIELTNLGSSTLTFGCADFTFTFDMEYYVFVPGYQGRPEVELQYSIDGVEWLPLNVVEDESLFHENHGNVFVADLSQLDSQVANHWVSCKFTLTDEAGNSQEQELSNLFFAGDLESVNEQVSIKHSVYPNPFTNEVRITTVDAVNGSANVQVYNVLGAQVYQQTVNCADAKEFVIDGSTLKPGIYFYRINTEKGEMRGKIVKE